jgi:ATP-binding protein involved in chromosome partitioning
MAATAALNAPGVWVDGASPDIAGILPIGVVQIAATKENTRRMPPTAEQVIEALRPVQDPELHRSIVDLGMVRDVVVSPKGRVDLVVALTVAGCPLRNEIERRVGTAINELDGVKHIGLQFTVMTDSEREELRHKLHGDPASTAGQGPAHGHAEGRAIPFSQPGNRTRPLLISSGKGGVGKSTVTTNLAVALAQQGHSVAIVDADVYGFSIPRMLGADRDPVVIDKMLIPSEAYGVRCISMHYFVPEGQAVVWRGPMLHKALEQFLTDVYWDDPDFLLVDMPPGTGDIAISLSQYLPKGEVYVVTTPQPAAQKVARLSAAMADKVHLDVKGVIENMSWFTGDDGRRYELFGAGGGAELAAELRVPLLGQLPLVPALRAGGDTGRPITAVAPESEAAACFRAMAERIAVELAPRRVYNPALKIV